VTVKGDLNSCKKCPVCIDGVLLKKTGKKGHFYSCSNYPVCKFKPLECPTCKSDILLRDKVGKNDIATCQYDNCKSIHECCDKCNFGILKLNQDGKYGDFLNY